MTNIDSLKIYSTNELNQLGYHSNLLTELTRQNQLTRVQRGFYIVNDGLDELAMIVQLFPEGILCLSSALYFYDYLDHVPMRHTIAVTKNNNRYKYRHSDLNLKAYFRDDKYINVGVDLNGYKGHLIKVYDRERTICDCIRRRKLISTKEYKQAIQSYIADPNKNMSRLREYGELFRISEKLEFLFEVWI